MAGQMHGKRFETMLKSAFKDGAAADAKRASTSPFDIEKTFDEKEGLPTQLKTVKAKQEDANVLVNMADARRQVGLNEDFRLVVMEWEQDGAVKRPTRLTEMYFKDEAWAKNMVGDLPKDFVSAYHEALRSFGPGEAEAIKARAKADEFDEQVRRDIGMRGENDSSGTRIRLNRKVDSKNQRRLQCSATLDDLKRASTSWTESLPNERGELVYRDAIISGVVAGPRSVRGKK